ncbi:MAG: OmpH family outer membrane protein [Saprospiraceae bacterium]|nr:OmpH family outer membrane protein [Saprospiraceae bacterium]MDW8483216.1 OmpH family outer membrane protein [Saprospiraceae bacterium]
MQRQLSLALQILLLIAVAHLYYLHFSGKASSGNPTPTAAPARENPPAAVQRPVRIAFVNADTLDAKYNWLKEQKRALEQRVQNAERSMKNKKEALIRDLEAFQEKYESGTVSRAQLEKEYALLAERQQKLAQEEIRLGQQLAEEREKALNELMAKVEAQLRALQAQIGYDFILSYSKGGGQVLYANDSLDITNRVLELLNAQKN